MEVIFFFAKSGTQKVKGFGPCGGASLYKALLNTSLPPRLFVCLFVLQQTTVLNRNLSDTFIVKTLIGDFRLKL